MKKILAFLLCLAMTLSLAACGGNNENSTPSNTPETQTSQGVENPEGIQDQQNANNDYVKDKVTVAWKIATSLSPWGTNNDIPGNYEVYEMLYECDSTGAIYPLLADASYEGSMMPGLDHEEGTGIYKVKIYDYITDHKGNPVKASDVAFSFMYQFQNEATSGWGDLVNVEAEDDTTVVFTFNRELDKLGELNNVLCRCFIVSEKSFNDSNLAVEMVGTGPYKFEKYESGASLTIVRNESYWQKDELLRQEQQANVNTIVYDFIEEAAQKSIALKTNEVDIVDEMAYEDAVDFADGGEYADKFNVFTYEQKFVYYLNPNCSSDSLCGDLNLRLAIMNAIDLDNLMVATGGVNTRANAYVSGYYSDFDMVDWAGLDNYNSKTSVDPAVVQGYLDQSSYKGEKLRLITTGNLSDVCTVISGMLSQYGIIVEVQALDMSSYRSTVGDASAWDIEVGMMAGDYNVVVWQHGFSFANNVGGDHTGNFIYDKEWDDMLELTLTEAGHTTENMQAWWQHAVDNGYTMGLYTGNIYTIIPNDMTYVCQGDKLVLLPGACSYAAP